MLFRKSYFFIVFIFNLSLVSFHFLKNLNFSGTTKYRHSGSEASSLRKRFAEFNTTCRATIHRIMR
ncbi:hypothetical protein C5473_19975 [Leptospira interrogans serovar Weerasinghe]|nr:hypothetical protein C5473_19975 [Leptospira interrogans serovar Weerasinghe]